MALMADGALVPLNDGRSRVRKSSPTWTLTLERVTGIEAALSAGNLYCLGLSCGLTCGWDVRE